MPNEESKNAVNVINGMFKVVTGQMMKTLDDLNQKKGTIIVTRDKNHQKKIFEKSLNLTPSMVFIGVSLNFGILEHSRI